MDSRRPHDFLLAELHRLTYLRDSLGDRNGDPAIAVIMRPAYDVRIDGVLAQLADAIRPTG